MRRLLFGGFLSIATGVPLALLLVPACGGSEGSSAGASADGAPDGAEAGRIRASDFDQSCTTSGDCAAIEDDTPCCTICPNAAVSRNALSAFNAERMREATLCTPQDRQCALPGCNTADHAACSSGRCVFVRCNGTVCPDADSGADAVAE